MTVRDDRFALGVVSLDVAASTMPGRRKDNIAELEALGLVHMWRGARVVILPELHHHICSTKDRHLRLAVTNPPPRLARRPIKRRG